jgi:PIN domain nuclease of toxin-antitoxin system
MTASGRQKYLLDTHVLIWALMQKDKLSDTAQRLIGSTMNDIFVSTISFWEISLKVGMKKFDFDDFDLENLVDNVKNMNFKIINLYENEAITYSRLPQKENHRDPFDRMLIWTAIKYDYSLISKDEKFLQYRRNGLKLIW